MRLQLAILLIVVTTSSRGQCCFDFKLLKFKGLEFVTTKSAIIKSFGQGRKVDTNNDCGFFINDHPDGPFYQIVYERFNFIGSDKGKFYLENVRFDKDGKTKINYGNNVISGRTTKADIIQLFDLNKNLLTNSLGKDVLIIYAEGSDDGIRFTFKNDVLERFEYWTPC